MKKSILLLLVFSAVSIFSISCKDDETSSNPADLIIGSWQFVGYAVSECVDPNENESETCTTDCEITVITKETVTFEGEPAESYSISGNKITFGTGAGADTYEFTVTETTLTVIDKEPGDCKEVTTLKRV